MVEQGFIFKNIEKNIEVNFKNLNLLKTALTHSSYANQKKGVNYNERLEYLGDAVLELVVSEYLFMNCKEKSEGDLTKLRALIVCENSLYEVGLKWNLGKYILMSKGEEITGGRTRTSIIANCVEAIIAAVYLDKGLNFAKEFIITNFKDIIEKAVHNKIILDYKTRFQEMLQQNGEVEIVYELVNLEGPPHRPKFYVDLTVNGEYMGSGEGYTKKEAEQNAAKCAVIKMEDGDE